MDSKFYLYKTKIDAQNLVDELTKAANKNIPYTEVRESNNGYGYAVRSDNFTAKHTNKISEDLPPNFYLDNAGI